MFGVVHFSAALRQQTVRRSHHRNGSWYVKCTPKRPPFISPICCVLSVLFAACSRSHREMTVARSVTNTIRLRENIDLCPSTSQHPLWEGVRSSYVCIGYIFASIFERDLSSWVRTNVCRAPMYARGNHSHEYYNHVFQRVVNPVFVPCLILR